MSNQDKIDKMLEKCEPILQAGKKFKPKFDEVYYSVLWCAGSIDSCCMVWRGNTTDYAMLKVNNCFKTRQEAHANELRIYKELTGKEWGEVDDQE